MCIVLDPEHVPAPIRFYPFDTGAFFADEYKDHFHEDLKCDDFVLESDLENAARVVRTFFETNNNYYSCACLSDLRLNSTQRAARAYYSLIRSVGWNRVDDRRSSIEVQMGIEVKLSRENVMAIILPSDYADDFGPQIQHVLEAELYPYPSLGNVSPQVRIGTIYDSVKQILADGNRLRPA